MQCTITNKNILWDWPFWLKSNLSGLRFLECRVRVSCPMCFVYVVILSRISCPSCSLAWWVFEIKICNSYHNIKHIHYQNILFFKFKKDIRKRERWEARFWSDWGLTSYSGVSCTQYIYYHLASYGTVLHNLECQELKHSQDY